MTAEKERYPLDRTEIEKRIAELDAKIEAYPYWGAALTAYAEERAALVRRLKQPIVIEK